MQDVSPNQMTPIGTSLSLTFRTAMSTSRHLFVDYNVHRSAKRCYQANKNERTHRGLFSGKVTNVATPTSSLFKLGNLNVSTTNF